MADERCLKGEEKAPERAAKLAKKRSGKAKKASERERLKEVELVSKYSTLKALDNEALSDQLKVYKLIERKAGFKTTGTGPEMRLQLQSLNLREVRRGHQGVADERPEGR
eukprot:7152210-Prymnesium_polylepis.1